MNFTKCIIIKTRLLIENDSGNNAYDKLCVCEEMSK